MYCTHQAQFIGVNGMQIHVKGAMQIHVLYLHIMLYWNNATPSAVLSFSGAASGHFEK